MINVEVRFFGGMHHFTRRSLPALEGNKLRLALPDGATVDDLLVSLGVATGEGRPFVSVNRYYQRDNVTLCDGDRVELALPMAGGAC